MRVIKRALKDKRIQKDEIIKRFDTVSSLNYLWFGFCRIGTKRVV